MHMLYNGDGKTIIIIHWTWVQQRNSCIAKAGKETCSRNLTDFI